jgi:predicted transcriptional regulator
MVKTPKRPAPKLDKRLTMPQLMAELKEASAEAHRGNLIPHAEIVRWSQSLGTANPLPMPVLRDSQR